MRASRFCTHTTDVRMSGVGEETSTSAIFVCPRNCFLTASVLNRGSCGFSPTNCLTRTLKASGMSRRIAARTELSPLIVASRFPEQEVTEKEMKTIKAMIEINETTLRHPLRFWFAPNLMTNLAPIMVF